MVLWAALVFLTESGPYGCFIMKNSWSTLALKVFDTIAIVVVDVIVIDIVCDRVFITGYHNIIVVIIFNVVIISIVTNISYDAFSHSSL